MSGITDFKKSSIQDVLNFILKSKESAIKVALRTMNQEQIAAIVQHLNTLPQGKNKEKLQTIIQGINSHSQLEFIGKIITAGQLLFLLNNTLKDKKQTWKLSPLLVGMSFDKFRRFIDRATDTELPLLQQEGAGEPIQHHLTMISHDLDKQITENLNKIQEFQKNLENLDTQKINQNDCENLFQQIDNIRSAFIHLLAIANKSLRIAWNTPRLDLINVISKLKKSCQSILKHEIGTPITPGGLYQQLEKRLFQDFGKTGEIDAVKDEEPASEALTKLSIWYPKDYWEIGLLPQIKNFKQFEIDIERLSDKAKEEHLQKLFLQVQKNLEALGLRSVKDLKIARIFSRLTLQEYIKARSVFNKR